MSGGGPTPTGPDRSANEGAVGAVLNELRTFRHNIWAPILLGIIMLFDSWDSIAVAFAMPTLSVEWKLNPMTMGFIISAGYGGQFLGALTLGAVAERFGRLPTFMVAVVLMSILAIGCAMSQTYTTLLVLRFVQGITIGGALPVASAYINELAPARLRGRYFGLFQTIAIAGFGVASLSSPFVIPTYGWRAMFALGAIPILFVPLVWLTLPESPRWLTRVGRLDDANRALARLGGLPATFINEAAAPVATVTAAPPRKNALALFTSEFRGRTAVITLMWFLTMYTSFGLTTWVPSIYTKVYHLPVKTALSYSAVTSVLIFFALCSAGTLIDWAGRRPFAIGGLAIVSTSMLSIALFQPANTFTVVLMTATAQVVMLYPAFIVWPYTAETYPTGVRALALGYGSSIGRAASMLTPLVVGFILNKGAPIAIVFTCFGLSALGAAAVWIFATQETKGKALESV